MRDRLWDRFWAVLDRIGQAINLGTTSRDRRHDELRENERRTQEAIAEIQRVQRLADEFQMHQEMARIRRERDRGSGAASE